MGARDKSWIAGLSCGKGQGRWLWRFHSRGSGSVGSQCRLSCSSAYYRAADLGENSRGRQSLLCRELLISAQAGEQPGDTLICMFGSHQPEGGQKRVRPRATINESLAALSVVRLCTLFKG